MISRIILEIIPHAKQRYDTIGDWQVRHRRGIDELYITISELRGHNWEHWIIGVHELFEAILCLAINIRPEHLDEFDKHFNPRAQHEPGDSPLAPYHIQHGFASAVERMLCAALNINWYEYERAVKNASRHKETKRGESHNDNNK